MIHPITRRQAIQKAVMFSTAMLTPGWLNRLQGQMPVMQFPEQGMHLLAVGDFGTKDKSQEAMARRMEQFASKLRGKLSGVLALGDNFYGTLTQERFQKHFEDMYSREILDCPFYFCLGNHDYEKVGYGEDPRAFKWEAELEYARNNPSSRWKQPAKWYALELPDPENPLVKLIVLDSNFDPGDQTPQSKLDQDRFLKAELEKKTAAPWTWVMAHHPLFSQTGRKDNASLIRRIGPYLQQYPVSLYLAGHCHTLQHIEVPGYHASFVVSGGGGAHGHPVRPDRGFARQTLGFNHIYVTREYTDVQFIDVDGNCLHSFRKTPDGKMDITTPPVVFPPKEVPEPVSKPAGPDV